MTQCREMNGSVFPVLAYLSVQRQHANPTSQQANLGVKKPGICDANVLSSFYVCSYVAVGSKRIDRGGVEPLK